MPKPHHPSPVMRHQDPNPRTVPASRFTAKPPNHPPVIHRLRRRLRLLAMLAIAGMLLTGCDWTAFRYIVSHTGFNSTESAISMANVSSLAQLYTGSTGGNVFSSPAVAKGVAYVGSQENNVSGKLYAFDAAGNTNCSGTLKTCRPLWTATTVGQVNSSPAVANGVVYVGSNSGSGGALYAFDAAGNTNCTSTTCAPLWTYITHAGVDSSPAVVNGVVYVGSDNGVLFAFDAAGNTNCSGTPKTCSPLWTAAVFGGNPVFSSPAVANGKVYVGAANQLYAFDAAGNINCSGTPKTCRPLWASTAYANVFSSPAVVNGVVYIGVQDGNSTGRLVAFDAAGTTNGCPEFCSPLWTSTAAGIQVNSSPAVANGVVYVGSIDYNLSGKLYAFDATGNTNCSGTPKTCAPLWTSPTMGLVYSSPAVANGLVYVGSFDHNFYAFDAAGTTNCSGSSKTCTPLWTATTGDGVNSSPAVANGRIYIGSNDFKLYAYTLPR
jgi:outer membrane protein assembly factor BamB